MARLQKISQGSEDRSRNLRDSMSLIIVGNRDAITQAKRVRLPCIIVSSCSSLCKIRSSSSTCLVPWVAIGKTGFSFILLHHILSFFVRILESFFPNRCRVLSRYRFLSPRVKSRATASLLRLLLQLRHITRGRSISVCA